MKVIYSIINLINNKKYVGSAINFKKRKQIHLSDLRNGTHHSITLQRSWEKYGEDNFVFIVLEEVDNSEDLIKREQWWIDNSSCEYNIAKVAGSSLGIKRRKETIEKVRQANLGLKHPEWRNKIKSIAQGGENHWTKQKNFSEESKKKMSETYLKLYENGFHPRHTKIKQLNLDGSLVKEFNSIKEAGEYYGYNPDAISNNIRNRSKTSYGYIWRKSID
jgi:group I intron endonuclease